MVRSMLQLVVQAWSDGLDGHPFRDTFSGWLVQDDLQNQKPYVINNAMWHQREVVKIKS